MSIAELQIGTYPYPDQKTQSDVNKANQISRRFYQFMFIWRGNPCPNAYIGCCDIFMED